MTGDTPVATLGATDVPAGMPAGSRSVIFNADYTNDWPTGQYATRAYTAALCGTTFTVSAWVKPYDVPPYQYWYGSELILGPLAGATLAGWKLRWNNPDSLTAFSCQIPGGGTWQSISGLAHTTGSWYHVVFQIEDNGATDNYRLYVNGVLESEILNSWDFAPDTAAGFVLGGAVNWMGWHGGLDDVQYYDYVLSANDVRYLYLNPGAALGPFAGTIFSFH